MAKILDPEPGTEPLDPRFDIPIDPPRPNSAIGQLYAALGGMSWARPGSEMERMRHRTGEFQHFLDNRSINGVFSIYWTPESGAHVVSNAIRWAYGAIGAQQSVLGCPTSEEMATHDGVGRYQNFESGQYVWHPDTGAHEVHGDIFTRYGQLGGTAFGYPVTDEGGTPDGRGRFNHFRELANGGDRSIYWTLETKAHEVYGYIREAWSKAGWETGPLGYPTSGELPTHDASGRHQNFERGQMVWHPDLGAHAVHGPSFDKYVELSGSVWGYPLNDITPTPDGRGTYLHVRNMDRGGDSGIYWTAETGAHVVYGAIWAKWAPAGAERSLVGYPTSDEQNTGDNQGRYQVFESGIYVWHADLGAWPVSGDILARYGQIGGSDFGYPINDQRAAKDGGQKIDLRHLGTNQKRSIYWSPATGAVDVYGGIRSRWSALGKEGGFLGFPVSPEVDWASPHDARGGREQQFQHGRILWSDSRGAAADPMKWLVELPDGGIDGHVEATAQLDGSVHFHAYVKGSSWQGYDYILQALLKSDHGMGIAFSRKAKVSSTHAGDDRNHHNQTFERNSVVAANYWEFQRGTLAVDEEHGGQITGFVGDLAEGLLKWTVGSIAFANPYSTLLLVAGVELAGLFTGGGLGAGARIIDGTMFLAGPNGTVFALLADALARLATNERELHQHEWELVDRVFKGSVPRDMVRISDGTGAGGRPFTYPRFDNKVVLNFGPTAWDDAVTITGEHAVTGADHVDGQLLIHEMVHAWQYINNDAAISYIGDAIWARMREVTDGQHDTYSPGVDPKEPWEVFGLEEQASIVDMWFADHYTALNPDHDHGLASPAALQDTRFQHVQNHVRLGNN